MQIGASAQHSWGNLLLYLPCTERFFRNTQEVKPLQGGGMENIMKIKMKSKKSVLLSVIICVFCFTFSFLNVYAENVTYETAETIVELAAEQEDDLTVSDIRREEKKIAQEYTKEELEEILIIVNDNTNKELADESYYAKICEYISESDVKTVYNAVNGKKVEDKADDNGVKHKKSVSSINVIIILAIVFAVLVIIAVIVILILAVVKKGKGAAKRNDVQREYTPQPQNGGNGYTQDGGVESTPSGSESNGSAQDTETYDDFEI